MNNLIRVILISEEYAKDPELLLTQEWLVGNGLGGYASSTVAGINTRRYHGLLISALPSPSGRMVMLNLLTETLIFPDGEKVVLTGEERTSCSLQLHGNCFLSEFRLEKGLPVWRYRVKDILLEKRIFMRHQQNTVQISWKILSGDTPVTLELHPAVQFRSHCDSVDIPLNSPYTIVVAPDHFELSSGMELPGLKMLFYGAEVAFTVSSSKIEEYIYRQEEVYGYPKIGSLWSPGYFQLKTKSGQEVTFVASTHSLETINALTPQKAYEAENERREILIGNVAPGGDEGPSDELALAADQFIISPAGRLQHSALLHAFGNEVRTVIAGYHWFTDWGRDTMISLEGLTLVTGRFLEARWILHTFAQYVRRGLIPNMFPEGQIEGCYNTADATLWFFHALDRYLEYTHDRTTLRLVLPKLMQIVEAHIQGTDFNIHVDPNDGLLIQGSQGYALTWMDAKVGEWVVTPRRGKAVEINALWYNALRLLEGWARQEIGETEAQVYHDHAELARKTFNQRFWYPEGGYLYDVVDGEQGNDFACRPNQLFALSLRFPVLEPNRWEPVINVVTERLLTPFGLRSLAPGHPDYKAKYFGDIRARDAAYHQGTVWAWLIGSYIDAWLRLYPDRKKEAYHFLDGIVAHLNQACIGSVSEIFDAEPPFTPRGCVAQAWSVAEALRCWFKIGHQ